MMYLFSIGLIIFTYCFKNQSLLKNKVVSNALLILMNIVVCFYILTELVIESDLINYTEHFKLIGELNLATAIEYSNFEILYTILVWIISKMTDNIRVFLLILYIIYSSIVIISLRKLYSKIDVLYSFFFFYIYFFYYNYIFNGIRQGFAMALLLLALSYFHNNKKSYAPYILIIMSALFHNSSIIMGIMLIIVYKTQIKVSSYFLFWLCSLFLSITGLNEIFLNIPLFPNNEYLNVYTDTSIYFSENKSMHILYSILIINYAYFIKRLKYIKILNVDGYSDIVSTYLLYNSNYLLLNYIFYSSRIAAYSWFLAPIIISYPLLNSKKGNTYFSLLIILFLTVAHLITIEI